MATKRAGLRVVNKADAEAEEVKQKKTKLTLAQAAESGSYLDILVAQRREMIRDVRDMTGPAKAAMHRQIALSSKEIAALEAEAEQEAGESAEVEDEEFTSEAL